MVIVHRRLLLARLDHGGLDTRFSHGRFDHYLHIPSQTAVCTRRYLSEYLKVTVFEAVPGTV